MRSDYVLVRGAADQERFKSLTALAARIHNLRGDRALHLKCFVLAHPAGDQGPCCSIKAGDAGEAVIGYALFPEIRAYEGDDKRTRLAKALLDLKPDQHRVFDGEQLAFSKAAA